MELQQEHGKEISFEELKVIQMDVLEAIDEFCREHDIRYSMACGTLLGAIRHKGYIPWDDDIDIYMLRDDYDELMRLFPNVFKGYFKILSLERDEKWDKPYGKAYDDRTVVYENADYNVLYGVNIDIFPVDAVPDNEEEWKLYDLKRRKLIMRHEKLFARIPFKLSPIGVLKWVKWNYPRWFTNRRKMSEKIDRMCKIWRDSGYDRVFECCQGIFQKKPFRKEIFESIVAYPFEDRIFLGFENYDEYLRNGFGDYMTLPPVEKRITHHSYKSYWKKQQEI